MSRLPLTLSAILLAASANAAFELPAVNPSKTVSAMDLYGVPPIRDIKPAAMEADLGELRASGARNADADILVPNKPSGDLWSNNNLGAEMPLRMPDKSEYLTLKSDFALPEETLGGEENGPSYFAAPLPKTQKVRSRPQPERMAAVESEPKIAAVMEKPEPLPAPVPVVRKEIAPVINAADPAIVRSMPKVRPVIDKVPSEDDEFAYKGDVPFTKLSPTQLKKAFKRTFTSENKHLSTYEIDDGYDETSFSESAVGFDSAKDLSEQGGVRPLEVKISFDGEDSALSRDNYNLLTEYAGIVASNPKRAVQVSISERGTRSYDGRKLAARRLAIIEQVLKDSGIVDKRIIPVLSQRSDDSFVLRVISSDMFQTLSEKKRDMFGDSVSSKSYKSMSW